MKKLRYPHWWFGRYIINLGGRWVDEQGKTFPSSQVNQSEMQEYIEHKHGGKCEDRRRFYPEQFDHSEKQLVVSLLNSGNSMWEVASRMKTSEKAIRLILRELGQQAAQGGSDGCGEAAAPSHVGA